MKIVKRSIWMIGLVIVGIPCLRADPGPGFAATPAPSVNLAPWTVASPKAIKLPSQSAKPAAKEQDASGDDDDYAGGAQDLLNPEKQGTISRKICKDAQGNPVDPLDPDYKTKCVINRGALKPRVRIPLPE